MEKTKQLAGGIFRITDNILQTPVVLAPISVAAPHTRWAFIVV